jgi:hypothetical protein
MPHSMQQLFKRALILAMMLCAGSAQAASKDSFGFWNQDMAQGNLGLISPELKNIRWWVEGQARVFDQLDHINQALARAAVGYTLLDDGKYNVALWAGYTWNPSRIIGRLPTDEHDIFPALTYSANTEYGIFSGRTMTDFRFREDGSRVGYRMRQQLRYQRPFDFEPRLSFIAWDEAFWNVNNTDWGQKTGIDQNRLFTGLGWNFTKNIRVETGYFNWFLNVGKGTDTVRHMLAVNLQANF